MPPTEAFWWTWSVSVVAAFATFLAVFVALFGDWLRARLFSPKLRISLSNEFGELTVVPLEAPDGSSRDVDCRVYHARISTDRRWPLANGVQPYIVRVEEAAPDGTFSVQWHGDVPLRWKLQEIHPLTRTLGPPADCDLIYAVQDKWIEIPVLVCPRNLRDVLRRREPFRMIVSVQARSNEADSPIARLEIAWDGKWADGAVEMRRHLVVKSADPVVESYSR
jgi:hypothetical protein